MNDVDGLGPMVSLMKLLEKQLHKMKTGLTKCVLPQEDKRQKDDVQRLTSDKEITTAFNV